MKLQMNYRERMDAKGFTISGTSPDGSLAELIELRDHLGLPRLRIPPGIPQTSRTSRILCSKASCKPVSHTKAS